MLFWDNHPSNDNTINSKKHHIFYDKKGHLPYAIFLIMFVIFNSLKYILQNIKKKHTMQRALFVQYFWSKTGILTFFMELWSYVQ